MKLKDATAGQHVWLEDGTECIVATGEAKIERLREVFRLDTFETAWLLFNTEVSTEPPPKPKPISKPMSVALVWSDSQEVVEYDPAQIDDITGVITIRPAKNGGSE